MSLFYLISLFIQRFVIKLVIDRRVCFLKNVKQFLILLFVILLVSGCKIKAEYNFKFNADKSIDLGFIVAMDDELIEGGLSQSNDDGSSSAQPNFTEDQKWEYIEEALGDTEIEGLEIANLKREKYDQDGFKGYKFVGKIGNIDDVTDTSGNYTEVDMSDINGKLFGKDGNTYKAKITLSTDESLGDAETEGVDLSSVYDVNFVMTFPTKPLSHNATSVSKDGKTLTWNIMKLQGKPIEVSFEFPKKDFKSKILTYAIPVIGGLVIVILLIVLFGKKKNKKQPSMNQTTNSIGNQSVMTGQPQPFQPQPVQPVSQPVSSTQAVLPQQPVQQDQFVPPTSVQSVNNSVNQQVAKPIPVVLTQTPMSNPVAAPVQTPSITNPVGPAQATTSMMQTQAVIQNEVSRQEPNQVSNPTPAIFSQPIEQPVPPTDFANTSQQTVPEMPPQSTPMITNEPLQQQVGNIPSTQMNVTNDTNVQNSTNNQ